MQEINWVQIGFGFLGGGAIGALIKQYFDNRRNKIQPVIYYIEMRSVYDFNENNLFDLQITLKENAKDYKFQNLYTGKIELINNGQQDFAEFKFGITCSDKIKFIQVRPITNDRHHAAELSILPSLENQTGEFDVILKPFNRKDNYAFNFLITSFNNTVNKSDLVITSPHPIKWVTLSSIIYDLETLLKSRPVR